LQVCNDDYKNERREIFVIIVEDEGYSVMLTGVTQNDIDKFFKYLEKNTPYSGIVGCSRFRVPKNGKKVDVFVIDCIYSKDGRREIANYWLKQGQKFDADNLSLLNTF